MSQRCEESVIALGLGLRKQEQLKLRRDQVTFSARSVNPRRTLKDIGARHSQDLICQIKSLAITRQVFHCDLNYAFRSFL
jgi:hypothetical protein